MDKLNESINRLSTQVEELLLATNEIRESITKQRSDELLKRLEKLEMSMKDQHIKLDALNAIDINPTIVAPVAPTTVRVAAGKNKAAEPVEEAKPVDEKISEFSNITEYFKHVWITDRESLYQKGVLTKEEYEKIYDDNKDAFDKKKKNELILQKSVATKIWKSLSEDRKSIVKAMKNQNNNDVQKKNSTEIEEETD